MSQEPKIRQGLVSISVNKSGRPLCEDCVRSLALHPVSGTCMLPTRTNLRGCMTHHHDARIKTCRGCYRLSRLNYFATECAEYTPPGATEPLFTTLARKAQTEGI